MMKKCLFVFMFATVAFSSVIGQKINDGDVPTAVKAAFTKAYPGLKAKWEKEQGNFEAGFKKDGKTMSATFESTGLFVESETVIKESELPADVLSYVKSNYNNKKIKESAKITNASGVVTYEAEVDDTSLIFDGNGKFIKSVKD